MMQYLFGGEQNLRSDAVVIRVELDLHYDSLFIWRGADYTF